MKPILRLLVFTLCFVGLAVLSSCSNGSQSPQQQMQPPPLTLAITTDSLLGGVVGTAYSQPIQATGGAPPFSWTVAAGALPQNFSLGSSSTNTVTVSGTPETAAQAVAFTIQVKDSAGDIAQQPYTISILLPSDGLVVSGSLSFGNQILGTTSGPQTETLTNNSTSDLAITGIATSSTSGSDFTQSSTTCGSTLAAGASCIVNATFTPAHAGPDNGTITIVDDATGSPQVVSLTGVGVVAEANVTLSPASLRFDTQLVDTTSPPFPLVVNNYGTAELSISSIAANGAQFAESDNCVPSLASGAACTIYVTFTPGTSGEVTGTLSLTDNAPGSPQMVALGGAGSTDTPLLTGSCFVTCRGQSSDPNECPAGQHAKTPATATSYPCGPVGSSIPIDADRACGRGSPRKDGHCVTQ
jgi:hypothetical protein